MAIDSAFWWERSGIGFLGGELCLRDTSLRELARVFGTPCYLYDRDRVKENARSIREALAQIPNAEMYYAIKANRHPLIVETLRPFLDGIDAASPVEVETAFAWGFQKVSFTGTSVSQKDLADVESFSSRELTITCDNITLLESISPEFTIGVRFNTGVGAAVCDQWLMGRAEPTKFGLHKDLWQSAMSVIARRGLNLRQIHHHIGSGWLSEGSQRLLDSTQRILSFFDENSLQLPPVLNIGGGVGIPLREGQNSFDYFAHFAALAKVLDRRFETVIFEPGDALVKDAGFLLLTVTYIEDREGTRFVGVDAGFNVLCLPAHYGLNNEITALRQSSKTTPAVVAGNLCEAGDIFSRHALLPQDLEPGEQLVVLNCGGYGQSMSSHHCGRTPAKEVVTP